MRDIKINLSDYLPADTKQVKKDKDLRKACKEFESLFTYELLKSMRKTVEKCDLFHGGEGEEIYESMLDQELSKKMGGYGVNSLSEMLYEQLSSRNSSTTGQENYQGHDILMDGGLPRWPLKASVSSNFGWRKDPFTGEKRFHAGIDLAAEEGSQVRASMSGKVIISDNREGYGNMVALDHGHGFVTIYAHNQDNLVKPGDWVQKGAPIARVGSSGRSTGPHLHFEIRRHGERLDPMEFLGS